MVCSFMLTSSTEVQCRELLDFLCYDFLDKNIHSFLNEVSFLQSSIKPTKAHIGNGMELF